MKLRRILALSLLNTGWMIGCSADVTTTDDSHKVEIETPKVEVGDEPVDLDPRTDEDVDVDTPAPGDT
jgi:hypothetical protein